MYFALFLFFKKQLQKKQKTKLNKINKNCKVGNINDATGCSWMGAIKFRYEEFIKWHLMVLYIDKNIFHIVCNV